MLTVIAIMALVMAMVMPNIIGVFSAGADAQGRNVIGSLFGAARGLAVESQSYSMVHVQIGIDGRCWAVMMKYDTASGSFVHVPGYPPQKMPSDMAFGEISDKYVAGGNYTSDVTTAPEEFTTFNVVFGPDGSLVSLVNGSVPVIDITAPYFAGTDKQQIWIPDAVSVNEAGVRAMTTFHYKKFMALPDRRDWLEKNGQFLCINPHTGKLLPTK